MKSLCTLTMSISFYGILELNPLQSKKAFELGRAVNPLNPLGKELLLLMPEKYRHTTLEP